MKNNPFLSNSSSSSSSSSYKKSNDRFNFLNFDNQLSTKTNSKVKKNIDHDPKSRFKTNNLKINNSIHKEFIITDADFPALGNNNNIHLDSTTKYKDIISYNQDLNIDNSKNNTISPGCVEISSVNGQICFNYGPLTNYQKMDNYNKNYQDFLSNDPNFIMNNAIDFMKHYWEKYRLEYDSVYGEGSYEDKFSYKFDYESDDDSESNTDLDSDFDNDIDYIDQYDKDYLV